MLSTALHAGLLRLAGAHDEFDGGPLRRRSAVPTCIQVRLVNGASSAGEVPVGHGAGIKAKILQVRVRRRPVSRRTAATDSAQNACKQQRKTEQYGFIRAL